MAVVADRVIVELEAKLDRYNANLKRAENTFARSIGAQQKDIRRLEQQIARSSGNISSTLRGLAGTFAAAFSVKQVQEFADGYTRFINQLQVAGVEGQRLARVQESLFEIAQRYGVQLESLGTLYSRGAQVSRELGATQADLIQFSSGVAAALKIQGTSATEAQGALLQLSQALGSGTVRAEEFNSINEGALPILKAVAKNMDAAGGSVARLKTLVNDGKVSSEAFFQAFLAGTADLEAQAEKASLTIGNAFTVLNNAIGVYIGQADDSLSATERVSEAIITLSENLDKVTTALAVLGSLLLGRYVAGAVAAASATGVVSTAIFAMQARAIGAATTMEALALASATAGRAMLAAFGGPVGLAVAALATGIYFLATRTNEGVQASEDYQKQLEFAKEATDRATDATDRLATATGRAREQALANAKALREETIQLLENAKAASAAARAKLQTTIAENRERIQRSTRNTTGAGSGYDPTVGEIRRARQREAQARADILAAEETVAEYNKQIYALDQQIAAAPAVRDTPGAGSGSGTSRRKPRGSQRDQQDETARKARRALQTQAQVENEIAQLAVDRLQAMADLSGTADDRAIADMAQLQADREAFERAIKLDADLSDDQRAELRAARDAADAEKSRAINVRRREQLADEALQRETAIRETEAQLIRTRGEAFDRTARQRRETEQRLIDLQFDEERAQLEAVLASETSTAVEKEIAAAKLDRLEELRGLAQETARLRNQSPFEKFLRDVNKSEDEINEDLERIAVDGLNSLTDGITNAITGAESLGDAFGRMADQIIADLIRIAVQQTIIAGLSSALGLPAGVGGGGGVGGFFSGLFGGRASGGHVQAGRLYRVTDGEGFVPSQSGQIIPLGRMRQSGAAGGVTLRQTVNVDARGVNPEGFAEHIKAAVRQETVAIVGEGMRRVRRNAPSRMAEFERDGV